MKMDIGSSQSWWWESHNRPKHSKWLQENLGDVEANVQSMLTLIEGDADSFAQRAEMYYKKRPDLLKVVEQFYRGYRALAERYDQLAGSVRQIPSAIQSQYGIVSESPRGSPFGKQMAFKKQLENKSSANSFTDSNELSEADGGDGFEVSSVDEKSVAETRDDSSSSSSSCSDGESEHSSLELQKLSETVERLQVENKRLTEKSREKQQQHRETEKRLHQFREDYLRAQKENNTLKAGVASLGEEVHELKGEKHSLERKVEELEIKLFTLQEDNEKLNVEIKNLDEQKLASEEQRSSLMKEIQAGEENRREVSAALRVMKGSALCMLRRNNTLADQISAQELALADQKLEISGLVEEVSKLSSSLRSSEGSVVELKGRVAELGVQVAKLEEENERQVLVISECGEEKREAIRQLCFTMDLLNKRNQWLEELVLSAKSKLNLYQEKLVAAQASSWRLFS